METYEHVAKREQVRLQRDRSQRNNCTHELTTLGQRIIAVETMVSMLHFDTTTDVMNKIREAQTNLRSANKSVQRIGSNNYLSLVQNAKLSVENAELFSTREKERNVEVQRLKIQYQEEKRERLEKDAVYERKRQEEAAVLRAEVQTKFDPAVAQLSKIRAAIEGKPRIFLSIFSSCLLLQLFTTEPWHNKLTAFFKIYIFLFYI